jgi:hypothetical protein
MKNFLALLLLAALAGCATTGLTDIVQKDVPQTELQEICGGPGKPIFEVYGCKRVAFNRCYIYVLTKAEHPSDAEYKDTVEHERRHCTEGKFH